MNLKLGNILVSHEEIQNRCKELANQIIKDYDMSKDLVVVCVLRGGVFFMTELAKYFPTDIDIKFDYNDEMTKLSKELEELLKEESESTDKLIGLMEDLNYGIRI